MQIYKLKLGQNSFLKMNKLKQLKNEKQNFNTNKFKIIVKSKVCKYRNKIYLNRHF